MENKRKNVKDPKDTCRQCAEHETKQLISVYDGGGGEIYIYMPFLRIFTSGVKRSRQRHKSALVLRGERTYGSLSQSFIMSCKIESFAFL